MAYSPSLSNFLAVAEYLNISKAAEHLHVSQQALSSYIKRLEQYYGMELFVRKPALALTPAGRQVLKAAQQIEQIHRELEETLSGKPQQKCTVNVGFMWPRVRQFIKYIPQVSYRDLYPNVSLRVIEENVHQLEELTASRKLDFYVGEGDPVREDLTKRHLFFEQYYLTITEGLLREYFGGSYPACKETFRKGVDLEDFLHLPQFVFPERITSSRDINQFYAENSLSPNVAGENPTIEMNMQMVIHSAGYTICAGSYIQQFQKLAASQNVPPFLAFPVKRPDLRHSISLVYRRDEQYPEYVLHLMNMIEELIRESDIESTPE